MSNLEGRFLWYAFCGTLHNEKIHILEVQEPELAPSYRMLYASSFFSTYANTGLSLLCFPLVLLGPSSDPPQGPSLAALALKQSFAQRPARPASYSLQTLAL